MTEETPTRRRRRKPPPMKGTHPYAEVFPMMAGDELMDLADDIKRNGLRDPIEVTRDGLLLEGRNRLAACKLAGVEPTLALYEGDEPAGYVLSKNIHRRHLSPGQQAMTAALVLKEDGRRIEGRWVRGSVVNPNVNPNSGTTTGITDSKTWQNAMTRAGIILDYAPELADPVSRGVMKIDKAFGEAENRRAPRKAKPKPRPVKPSTVAVLVADMRMTLQKARARELSETVLKDLSVLRREIDRILKDDLNGTG